MATKRIETHLTIKALDQYSGVLRNMRSVTGRFADGVRTELSRLQGLRGPLKVIEDFRKQQQVVRRSGDALEAAREKQRRLLAEIRATRNPTARMRREFERARGAVDRLEQAHHRNRRALHAMQGQLRQAGVNTGDLAGEQRRLAGSIDRVTTSFGRQMERLQRLEKMQTRIADARKTRDGQLGLAANLSFAGAAASETGRRILTPLSQVANRSGDLEEKFADFQNLTGIDDSRVVRLREELDGLRDVTRTSVSDMLDGLGVLVGKGMDFEDALAVLPAAGRAAKATKTSFDEMGASGFALFDNLKVAPEDMAKAFDVMAMGGKEGGFELSAMARKFPKITAGARALRMEGLDSVAQLTAALQVAMKSAGSEDQAATNLSNFLGKLTSPETVRRFAKMGVSIEDELRKASESGVSSFEHMVGVIEDLTGGDALKMGELFGDKQVLDFLRAMIPNLEEYRRIKTAALSADGTIDADLKRIMDTYNESKSQLRESWSQLFTLTPEMMESLTDLFQTVDAIVERLIVWKKENPKLVKTLLTGTAAVAGLAIAGGTLLTAAAGLIGTMAVLRFGVAAFGARAAFAAGDIAGIGAEIGRVNRRRFSLVRPNLARHVSDFVDFRRGASSEISRLALHVDTQATAMNRSLSKVRWKAFIGAALTYNAIQAIPEDPAEREAWQKKNVQKMDETFRKVPGLGQLMAGYEHLFEMVRGEPPPPAVSDTDGLQRGPSRRAISPRVQTALSPRVSPRPVGRGDIEESRAADTIERVAGAGPLPTPGRIGELRAQVGDAASEVADLENRIAALGDGQMSEILAMPLKDELGQRKRDLADLQRELANAEQASADLQSAMTVLGETQVAPEINTAAIDQALAKVRQLSASIRSLGAANPKAPPLKPAGARAGGGPVRMGLPYLVNENTPRSEWFVPSRSGGILNVGQAQSALRTHLSGMLPKGPLQSPDLRLLQRGARGMRSAHIALLASSTMAAPAADAPVGQGAKAGNVRVQIGSISIAVPPGVTDTQAIVEGVLQQIGDRLDATISASFSD